MATQETTQQRRERQRRKQAVLGLLRQELTRTVNHINESQLHTRMLSEQLDTPELREAYARYVAAVNGLQDAVKVAIIDAGLDGAWS